VIQSVTSRDIEQYSVVVGDGMDAASCNQSSLANGIASMYAASKTTFNVTFSCTSTPVIISITDQIWLYGVVDIDGGGLVTLDGGGTYRQFVIGKQAPQEHSDELNYYPQPIVTLRNLYITNGRGNPAIVVRPGLTGSAG